MKLRISSFRADLTAMADNFFPGFLYCVCRNGSGGERCVRSLLRIWKRVAMYKFIPLMEKRLIIVGRKITAELFVKFLAGNCKIAEKKC